MHREVSAALPELWPISVPCADTSQDSAGHLLHQELAAEELLSKETIVHQQQNAALLQNKLSGCS